MYAQKNNASLKCVKYHTYMQHLILGSTLWDMKALDMYFSLNSNMQVMNEKMP